MSTSTMRNTYDTLPPFDWTVSSIMTEGRDHHIITREGWHLLLKLYGNGWTLHDREGYFPFILDALDIWTACRWLYDREARVLPE